MSTTIIEGTQYALSSQINKNQSMVFVKLTDSALKAIEDYALAVSKGDVSPNFKPSIEFRPNNSQGVITIPSKLNVNETEKQSYNFSIKDVQNDGILDCVQQNKNLSMESLGKIMLRMQIHANDDSYQTTKAKMAVAAEQEQKKYNTKVINSSDPNVGRKVKVNRPFNSKFGGVPSNSAITTNANSSNSSSMYKQSVGLAMPRFNKFSMSSNSNNISKNNTFHSVTDNSKRTAVREHLVHLLAVRTSKLAELQTKLQERLKEQIDKNTIISVLNSISIFKDGTYQLNDSLWEEVQIDWSHYSKEDRELVLKHNPLMQTQITDNNHLNSNGNTVGKLSALNANSFNPNGNSISPLSDGSSRSLSSPSSMSASPNLKNSPYNKFTNLKRNNEPVHGNSNLKKFKSDNPRALVSGNVKAHLSANTSAIVKHSSPLNRISDSNINLSGISDHDSPDNRNYFANNTNCYKSLINESSNFINVKKVDISNDNKDSYSRVNNYQRLSGNGSGSINSTPNSSPDSGISHIGNVLSSDSSINNDSDDYLSKYTKVQSSEQLSQYKSDFNADYPEYRRLYDYVESVCCQFKELRESILSKEEESDEWHDLIRQTIEKYDEVKKSSKYSKANKRLYFLHYKLIHIKNLINEFNRNHHDNKSSSGTGRIDISNFKSF